jgi:hypothetical protein
VGVVLPVPEELGLAGPVVIRAHRPCPVQPVQVRHRVGHLQVPPSGPRPARARLIRHGGGAGPDSPGCGDSVEGRDPALALGAVVRGEIESAAVRRPRPLHLDLEEVHAAIPAGRADEGFVVAAGAAGGHGNGDGTAGLAVSVGGFEVAEYAMRRELEVAAPPRRVPVAPLVEEAGERCLRWPRTNKGRVRVRRGATRNSRRRRRAASMRDRFLVATLRIQRECLVAFRE